MRYERIPSVDVPEGEKGDWKVTRFEVSEKEAEMFNFRAALNPQRGFSYMYPGTYTKLLRRGYTIMSDTPDEKRDHLAPVIKAQGAVLINGLGLGMVLNAVALKPEVNHVWVVEIDPDLIELVGIHYQNKFPAKITLLQADALTWFPPKGIRFDVAWHDIWDNICLDNLPEMTKLHRRFGRRTAWQGLGPGTDSNTLQGGRGDEAHRRMA